YDIIMVRIVLHTHPGEEAFAKIYEPLLGNDQLGGLSLQMGNPYAAHAVTKKWVNLTQKSGAPWIMTVDETGPWYRGLDPDTGFTVDDGKSHNHDSLRAYTLWGNLMAGGAGVEWYFGAKNANNDLNAEDWRSRDAAWEWTANTINFFQDNVPFAELDNHNELVDGEAYCLSNTQGGYYLVYLPQGETTTLTTMPEDLGPLSIRWYQPAANKYVDTEDLIDHGGKVTLTPPDSSDWAVEVQVL
ncbi:MAG: putative collagen-binding domain-containing protein, partial [Bacteroidota bacterium]